MYLCPRRSTKRRRNRPTRHVQRDVHPAALDQAQDEAQIGARDAALPAAAGQLFEQGLGFIKQRPEGFVG